MYGPGWWTEPGAYKWAERSEQGFVGGAPGPGEVPPGWDGVPELWVGRVRAEARGDSPGYVSGRPYVFTVVHDEYGPRVLRFRLEREAHAGRQHVLAELERLPVEEVWTGLEGLKAG